MSSTASQSIQRPVIELENAYLSLGSDAASVQILKGISKLKVVGGDIVEVAPSYDANSITAQLAAHLAYELICLI